MNTGDMALDATDLAILAKRFDAREQIDGPRIGDYVRFPTGELERFSRDCGDGLQTSPSGAFYLLSHGQGSLSCGGLNGITPLAALELTRTTLPGPFWFFHHGSAGPGRGVSFKIPCRVYSTRANHGG